jgi:peroxiredoxin Q/BCP
MYGKTFWGAKRATFVIDEEGIVRRVIKAHPETHDEDVLTILGELNAAA